MLEIGFMIDYITLTVAFCTCREQWERKKLSLWRMETTVEVVITTDQSVNS